MDKKNENNEETGRKLYAELLKCHRRMLFLDVL
jgi:hypothetical protein